MRGVTVARWRGLSAQRERGSTLSVVVITPDNKDWTWVLERPCPECGFDARDLDVAATPTLVRDLAHSWVEVLARPDVAVRTSPDKWSDLEYACHVRDVFRVFDRRLAMMIAEDGAHFDNWDQDATAVEERYETQDPEVVAGEMISAADTLAQRFSQVDGDVWAHRGVRSNGSEFSVITFAQYLAHDVIHHLWDVRRG